MWLDKYIKEKGILTDYPCFDMNSEYICVTMSTTDLLLAQFNSVDFNAFDIVVKYLAIENFYGENSYGMELYRKMQTKRINEDWTERFKELIVSFESGIDMTSYIKTDLSYSIHDGAHRLALALYHGIKYVPVKIFNLSEKRRYYGIQWFVENGFAEWEIKEILNKYSQIINKWRKPYFCILWPPIRHCYDKVLYDIKSFDPNIHVCETVVVHLTENGLKEFVYDVYRTDDIAQYKLDLKYEHLINSMRKDSWNNGICECVILKFIIDYPDFRLKPLTGLPQSKATMSLKRKIRDKYKEVVYEYYHDIIMHTTDNQIQNDAVDSIVNDLLTIVDWRKYNENDEGCGTYSSKNE